MVRFIRLAIMFGLVVAGTILIATGAQAASARVEVLEVQGVINPVIARYIERGINEAEQNEAAVCIIQMDTPGGLDTPSRKKIKKTPTPRCR
jgi:membrane-bound serine protease (ClpP class)